MITGTIDPTTLAYLIDKFGFPIGVAIVLLCVIITLVMLIIRSIITRQKLMDSYYFKNLDDKLDEHNKSLKEIHNELVNVVVETRTILTKIDACTSRLDRQSDNKSVTYVFKDGKICEIRNIIEDREVMQDIERKTQYKL